MLDLSDVCVDDKLYPSFRVGNIDYDRSGNTIREKHHEDICLQQSETLSEDETDKVNLLSNVFSVNDLDILQDDNLKMPVYSSEFKNYPLVYKGKSHLFYFEPIEQMQFERSIGTDFKKPVLKLKRFISENEKIKQRALKETKKKPKVRQNIKKVVEVKKKKSNYLYIIMFVIFLVVVVGIFISFNA